MNRKTNYVCPTCKVGFQNRSEYFPFCSDRCKLIDLGAWAAGEYMIKGEENIEPIGKNGDKNLTGNT